MSPCHVSDLVASVQRRTRTRAEAHFVLCGVIASMCLDAQNDLALRDAAYRRLYPEHAHQLADDRTVMSDAGRRAYHA